MDSPAETLLRQMAKTAMRDALEATETLEATRDDILLTEGGEEKLEALAERMKVLVNDAYTFAGVVQGLLKASNIGEYTETEAALIVTMEAMQIVREETTAGLTMELIQDKVTFH